MLKKLSLYLYIFYCFEIGIFLLVVPWMLPQVWEQNYFFYLFPWMKTVFLNGYFRGAISGLGLLNISLGIAEIVLNERSKHYSNS